MGGTLVDFIYHGGTEVFTSYNITTPYVHVKCTSHKSRILKDFDNIESTLNP